MRRFSIILSCSFILIVALFSGLNVNSLTVEDVTILSSRSIDDLPDTEFATNDMYLDRVTFGYISDDYYTFFEILSSSTSRYCILYISKDFYNGNSGEIIDNQIDTVYSALLISYQDVIINKLHDLGYHAYVGNQSYVFTQFNYLDYICYRSSNYVDVYLPNVESAPLYYESFGQVNTMYYQYDFYNNILAYYYDITEGNSFTYSYNLGSQKQYEIDSVTINSLNDTIAEKNELINELYGELNDPQNTDFTNFTLLLSEVSTYPIKFLSQGLDVELWGVNIGALLLGIFMLSISITIIGFISTLLGRSRR